MNEPADREQLLADLTRARGALREAIALVESGWERPPVAAAGGEASWSPREAAEHAITADRGFTAMIARALELTLVAARSESYAAPATALAALADAGAEADRVLSHVGDEQLGIEVEFAGYIGELIRFAAGHLREHARQVARIR